MQQNTIYWSVTFQSGLGITNLYTMLDCYICWFFLRFLFFGEALNEDNKSIKQ